MTDDTRSSTPDTLEFGDPRIAGFVYGQHDGNLKAINRALNVIVSARGARIQIDGDDLAARRLASNLMVQMFDLVQEGFRFYPRDVTRAIQILEKDPSTQLKSIFLDTVLVTSRNKIITPRGLTQKDYVDSIRKNDIVFGVGPAGTGKTYLAMAMALSSLMAKNVQRVILTRPAVEAGEKLGFLPGDLIDKVNPYLRPLYDALYDMVGYEKAQQMIERNDIEVAPLAFMRGRTLSGAFVILDEAQNTTKAQMKMFLTRLGFDSKAVITGDITQIDLERSSSSGLVDAQRVLRNVRGIGFTQFTQDDVVRHPLVMQIIQAYAKEDARREARRDNRNRGRGRDRDQGGGDDDTRDD